MEAINVYQAKTTFSSLVERAEKGETILIARAGKPVARLMPLEEGPTPALRPHGSKALGLRGGTAGLDDPLPEEYQRALGMID